MVLNIKQLSLMYVMPILIRVKEIKMRKKKILKSIIIILILIEGVSLYLLYRPNNNKLLEDIKTKEIPNSKDRVLAIKVQDADTFEYKDATTTADWPSSTTHYYYGTSCVDETGQDLGNTKQIVEFDDTTNTATITTKKTVYCTIYFAYKKDALELMKKTTTDSNLLKQKDASDKLIRYIGTYSQIKNNYICFGTSNISTCTGDKDKYMYRIIGIQAEDDDTVELKQNQLKIIKATPVKENGSLKTIAWATNNSSDIDWDNASNTVRPYLNTTFLSTIDTTWKGIISNPKWYIGDDKQATSTTGITNEKKKQTTGNYQVGLMYASDYYNSWSYGSNTNSWLHIIRGTSSSSTYSSQYEWTMTRYGLYDSYYWAWYVDTGSSLSTFRVDVTIAVRPVFYLSSNIKLSGEGTEDSPFIITTKSNN